MNYLEGALYKAMLDLKAKEYEYCAGGMRISFDLSLEEIICLLDALKYFREGTCNEQFNQDR